MFTPDHPDFDWSRAKCRVEGKSPKDFFPTLSAGPNDVMRRLTEARIEAYCATCPLNTACYQAAVLRDERHGFWGGVSFEVHPNRRRPARPLIRKVS